MAIEYGEMIHTIVKKFPRIELFALASDLNRAGISISSNIAEGSGSDSKKEFKRYIGIAVKSIFETISQLFIARKRNYISEQEFLKTYEYGELLTKKVLAFRKALTSQ